MEHLDENALRQLYADPAGAARQARDKLAAARVWLMKHKPFFGVLARALRLEATLEVPGYRLLPDDRLRFNPIVVMSASFAAICARLAHLSMHAALAAFGRRHEREPRRWNVAHDLAIAPLLDAGGLSVGTAASGMFAELPPGASAEQYYELLEEGLAPDPLWCDLCDPPTPDAPPAGTYTRQDGGDSPEGDADRETISDAPSIDSRGLELQWKMRLAAAHEEEVASGGKTFGDMPDWIDELVRATIEPPAHWSVLLQQAVTTLRRTERSYLRPSRRMSALMTPDGQWPELVLMPGRRIESAGQLVAVVDTSGSVSADLCARFLGVVASVATAEGIDEVRLMQADAAVTSDQKLYAAELLFQEVAMTGRGGTDFGPALVKLAEEARASGQRFTVAYLTDLDGRFPSPAPMPALDVLWVCPHPVEQPPPFGRVVPMSHLR